MIEEDDELLCYQCVTDDYLSMEIKHEGIVSKCSSCGKKRRAYSLELLADRVEQAFDRHFEVTSDEPTEDEYRRQFSDPESTYTWYREGESLPLLLEDMGGIPEVVAQQIQDILQSRYNDYDVDYVEQKYGNEALYEMKGVSDEKWQKDWEEFERTIHTESRFFSKWVYDYLSRIFTGVEKFTSYRGSSLVRKAGPSVRLKGLYRARVFQDQEEMLSALKRPDEQIGTPQSRFARGGRMNAPGIAVFYGATSEKLALAEVRPPVGSKVVIGYFDITRPLRLLDLTVLRHARAEGSIFDPRYAPLQEKALFLNRLVDRIALPVMPSHEHNDYLPTQIIADFLSEAHDVQYDGVIFSSTQSKAEGSNVVLFHRAARVKEIEIRAGSVITAHSRIYEPADGEYESYNVVIQQPVKPSKKKLVRDHIYDSILGFLPALRRYLPVDNRQVSLNLHEHELKILEVEEAEVKTKEFDYRRSTIRKEGRVKKPGTIDF